MRIPLLSLLLGLGAGSGLLFGQYEPPANYYPANLSELSGRALEAALHEIISDDYFAPGFQAARVISYNDARFRMDETDRDPLPGAGATGMIRLIYSDGWAGEVRSGAWDSGATWNREHTWPDSRGVGQPDTGPDFSDLHHLRACDPSVNSWRSNSMFGNANSTSNQTDAPNARYNGSTDTFTPPDKDKGWIARAMFYMATRYDGGEANTTNLILVENPPRNPLAESNIPKMGVLSVLLQWNRAFPPSEWERARNHYIFTMLQGNRNPFIDDPSLADRIYEAWRLRHFSADERLLSNVVGDLIDLDGDGLSNLVEEAFELNPRIGGGFSPLTQVTEGSTTGRVKVTWRRRAAAAVLGQFDYFLQVTTSPIGPWSFPTSPTNVVVGTEGVWELIETELTLPAGAPPLFVRVGVARQ